MVIINLSAASQGPTDAYFVLGGSIMREIHVARLIKDHPDTRVLISQGSSDPCILQIFEREQVPIERTWLEKCADSTFGNFFFSLPILQQWGVHRVSLITSATHLPRALWMAQVILGSHGIWVDLDVTPERGIPGNQESWLKTSIDVGRSVIWALVSQVYQPSCSSVTPLSEVNLEEWRAREFKCEHQGGIEGS